MKVHVVVVEEYRYVKGSTGVGHASTSLARAAVNPRLGPSPSSSSLHILIV
jgi:hypothetical protein